MRIYELGSVIIIAVIVIIAAVGGRMSSRWWGQDNPAEEMCEVVEASLTGTPEKDYSPESPEAEDAVPAQETR